MKEKGLRVEAIQSSLFSEHISRGRLFYKDMANAAMKWKMFVFFNFKLLVMTMGLSDKNDLRFVLRFLLSLFNDELLYFIQQDYQLPFRKRFMDLFSSLSSNTSYYDFSPAGSRNRLIADMLQFHFFFQQQDWSEIEQASQGLTWIGLKERCFGRRARKVRVVEKEDCECEFSNQSVGFCLEKLSEKLNDFSK